MCAAVDKIKEKRKPEDFVGYRKRKDGLFALLSMEICGKLLLHKGTKEDRLWAVFFSLLEGNGTAADSQLNIVSNIFGKIHLLHQAVTGKESRNQTKEPTNA